MNGQNGSKVNAVSSGIRDASRRGGLAKDAAVAGRNKGLDSNRNYSSSISSSPSSQSSSSSNTYNRSSSSSALNSILNANHYANFNNKNNKRKKEQERLKKAAQFLEKMPNPYAKAAAKAMKIAQEIKKKQGFLKEIFDSKINNNSQSETDEMLAANQNGTEYEPGQGFFSVNATLDKKTKLILLGGLFGLGFSAVFVCIILMSAVVDTAGQSYLASNDNPTESEFEEQYQVNESDDVEDDVNDGETSYLQYNIDEVQFVAKTEIYDSSDLSDYFGTKNACTRDGSSKDCRNGNEYKFYLKMYDMYYLYKNKYGVTLDLPLIMASLYYNSEQLPDVFKMNLNSYDRQSVKDNNQITNLDWEYDYKKIDGYQYLDADDFRYDMQILAKNMVTKTISYKCSDGSSKEAVDIETSNYSDKTLKCDNGSYKKDSVSESYKLDTDKFDKFLLEYVRLKYHTKGSGKDPLLAAENTDTSGNGSVSGSGTLSFNGKNYTQGAKNSAPGVYQSSEPHPSMAINYWKFLDPKNFVYPTDEKTGKSLGAWPKDYAKYPTQLENPKVYQGNFIWPSKPKNGIYTFVYEHNGIDIMGAFGTPIYSPADGTLVYSEWGHTVNRGSDETAYSVTITCDKTVNYAGTAINTLFLTHMSGIRYRCGWGQCNRKVKKGELLGFVGNAAGTSYSVGWAPHLHMTMYNSANYSGGVRTSNIQRLYNITHNTKRNAGE